MKRSLLLGAAVALAAAGQALAWGSSGHRMIGQAAVDALPPDLPGFVRSHDAAVAVGEYSREPDRSRGAGKTHDSDRDPGHFVDGDDAGKVAGVLPLTALPLFASSPPPGLAEPTPDPIADALATLDPDRMSPREALDELYRLRSLMRGGKA